MTMHAIINTNMITSDVVSVRPISLPIRQAAEISAVPNK